MLHRNWALYDVEHVVFQPRQMSPERLQEGLEWAWQQSYSLRSMARRISGAPWSILPLWVSLNLGYRYYSQHLHEKTWPIYRDETPPRKRPELLQLGPTRQLAGTVVQRGFSLAPVGARSASNVRAPHQLIRPRGRSHCDRAVPRRPSGDPAAPLF